MKKVFKKLKDIFYNEYFYPIWLPSVLAGLIGSVTVSGVSFWLWFIPGTLLSLLLTLLYYVSSKESNHRHKTSTSFEFQDIFATHTIDKDLQNAYVTFEQLLVEHSANSLQTSTPNEPSILAEIVQLFEQLSPSEKSIFKPKILQLIEEKSKEVEQNYTFHKEEERKKDFQFQMRVLKQHLQE